MSTTTPNMDLTKPGVNTTPGPDWANQLNSSLDKVDTHDHSSGKGVKITPAGMNINADLTFNGNAATDLKNVSLNSVVGEGLSNIYQNGGNLFWRNGSGTDVRITNGSTIDVGALGTIGGDYSTDPANPLISFSTATGRYDFFKSTLSGNIPGGLNTGAVSIFEEATGTNPITIQSPNSLAAAYNITLPIAQAGSNNSLVQVQTSGQLSYTRAPTAESLGIGVGTTSTPTLYSEVDVTTGLYFPATNEMAFVSNNNIVAQINDTSFTMGFAGGGANHVMNGRRFGWFGDGGLGSLADPGSNLFAIGHRGANILLRQGESGGGTINPFRINSNMNFDGTNYVTNTGGIWGTQLAIGGPGGSSNSSALEMLTSTGATGSGSTTTLGTNWKVTHDGATLGTNGSSSAVTHGFLLDPGTGSYRSSGGNLVWARSGVDGFALGTTGSIPRLTPTANKGTNLGDTAFRWNSIFGNSLDLDGDVNCSDITANNVTCVNLAPSGTLTNKLGNANSTAFNATVTTGSGSVGTRQFFWHRVGDIVTVNGQINGSFTMSGTNLSIDIDLPVVSSLTSSTDVSGTVTSNGGTHTMTNSEVSADTSGNQARITVRDNGGGSPTVSYVGFSFSYEVK